MDFLKITSWILHCGGSCSSQKPEVEVEVEGPANTAFPGRFLAWAERLRLFYSCLLGSILFKHMTMESEKISEKQEEILSILEEKFPSLPPREDIITVLQESHAGAQGEWPSRLCRGSEQGCCVGWSAARPQKVNLTPPALCSLLLTLMDDFQALGVSSPGSRQPAGSLSSEAFVSGCVVNSHVSYLPQMMTWNLQPEQCQTQWDFVNQLILENKIKEKTAE